MLFYRCSADKKAQNMTQSLHPAAQQGFSSAAELYQQARPNYPQQIVTWLQQQLNLDAQSTVVDLGSGTGKFLPYLQQVTSHIIAVEPIAEMLTQLQQAYPQISTLQASSDRLPIASESIDAVICAQSFHWFANIESLNEIHQILKPHGQLGLVWNQRDIQVDWVKALADVLEPSKVIPHDFIADNGNRCLNSNFYLNWIRSRPSHMCISGVSMKWCPIACSPPVLLPQCQQSNKSS